MCWLGVLTNGKNRLDNVKVAVFLGFLSCVAHDRSVNVFDPDEVLPDWHWATLDGFEGQVSGAFVHRQNVEHSSF